MKTSSERAAGHREEGDDVRVAFIGAGANSQELHIPGLQAIPGVKIVGVSNRSVASGKKVAEQFGIPTVYGSWRELLDDPEVDAVVVGTWPDSHAILTCAALESGKHVLCEARMARDVIEARQMLQTSEAFPNLVAQLVPAPFTFRFDRTIQKLIAGGYVGDVLAIDVRANTPTFIDRAGPMRWRSEFAHTGYNTMTVGIWYETLMRWVGEASSVAAMSKVFVKQRFDESTDKITAICVPDHFDILADMVCGAQANMRFSTVTGLPGSTASAWIYGSEGTLHLDKTAGKLYGGRRGDAALAEIAIKPEEADEWRVESDFIDSIRRGTPVNLTNFKDGLRYMNFTEAVARSAISGETIRLF